MPVDYHNILQMGLQSLAAIALGYGAGAARLLDGAATVAAVNALVLRVCIPCLQLWLLAVKTDMRRPGNWAALGLFLAWSLLLQALLAAWQLWGPAAARDRHLGGRQRRLDAARLGVDSLLLTTNNTGILGPVVLVAALGPSAAPLGMLATVALYFQQLPSAQLLFEYAAAAAEDIAEGGRAATGAGHKPHDAAATPLDLAAAAAASLHHLHHPQHHHHQQQHAGSNGHHALVVVRPDGEDVGGTAAEGRRETGEQQEQEEGRALLAGAGTGASAAQQQQRPAEGALARAAQLLARDPLVWWTGASTLLSCLGSSAVLDTANPASLRSLAFVDGLLGWFAQTTAPLTLFCTGLWMHRWAATAAGISGGSSSQQQQEPLSWRRVATVLALRATLAPALMALLCLAAGLRGDAAAGMVILALLPLAQTAFVIAERHGVGTAEVSAVTVASLLLMLPQLVAALRLLEACGLLLPAAAGG